ncbi:glycosyltransferase family 2 protein [Aneurinibacillus aneurinilyticus]|jgi:glycosyltransferase involved in cell wall biosynthesis|uniref:Glucosyl-3-phosphoglycerate synthase n=2 Tax=Aneurinibacillus aneurinilyticus TaxID=1391 RepID=A0A848CU49_ANEAE|nr:glycosyltransferase family 2 protein [Aneurinibacillus aneurinilyticus]ERI05910.1 glycosyltransferase, group 2 family protein [Aneurinibacillus aneurinilyticus ATCC 12856]MCI1692664.1 glycosyltransferase family 2 protein [Aneurinibacillus aneurinilyticus]MED0672747.1 glycosyltransferase family 2 protein [Aneurinibacillus aneurinilyticus]MED0708574.1 glycosyltransferase family 2 protein [Aneurinibacillus aneurinilyticus]MED0721734.1 glycosyltransferase family 2 protein [Aneurinibacillus aneu
MKGRAAIIVPAYNEASYISETLRTLRQHPSFLDCWLVVVDDGSEDGTGVLAKIWADDVVCLHKNEGKGKALRQGIEAVDADYFLFVDADVGTTARYTECLLSIVRSGECEMAIACPPAAERGGFGLAKRLARRKIRQITGITIQAPLSGQRALTRRAVEAVKEWDVGFGIEAAMTVDVLRAGLPIREVPLVIRHREHGKSLEGFWHRGRQYLAIQKVMAKRREIGR